MDPAGPLVVTDPAGSGAAPPREVGGPARPRSSRSVLALGSSDALTRSPWLFLQELDGRGGGGGACSGAAAAEGSASRLAGAGLGGEATAAFRDVSRAFVLIRACPHGHAFKSE